MASTEHDVVTMDKIVALCKRRGFIFQSSEIYGGLASTYDLGHYGVLLKTNVKSEWWRAMVQQRDDVVALDAAIIMHPRTWEASGHLEGFTDPLVQCLGECKKRWREDHLREEQPEGELRCPECGGELSEPRQFNLMFKTHMGPVEDDASGAYLRPETAQGIFVNFKNVLQFARKKPPFGIAQIGRSELEGIANRGDFDLTQHAKFSGEKLEYVDTATGDRYVPHVVEPAAGVDRSMLAFMVDAYDEEEVEGRQRTLLRLHPRLAPVKVAVLPLVSRDGMPEKARETYEDLRGRMPAEYDEGGSIGRRYRRQDEIGTPWGVTIDGQTIEDDTVTLRDRDSLEQIRVPVAELGDELERRLAEPWTTPKLTE